MIREVYLKIAIALFRKKIVDGVEHTEIELNGFTKKDTRDKFNEAYDCKSSVHGKKINC